MNVFAFEIHITIQPNITCGFHYNNEITKTAIFIVIMKTRGRVFIVTMKVQLSCLIKKKTGQSRQISNNRV